MIDKPISCPRDALKFFAYLFSQDKLFHPDDDPADIVVIETGDFLFDAGEVELIRNRIDEVRAVVSDPCSIILRYFV